MGHPFTHLTNIAHILGPRLEAMVARDVQDGNVPETPNQIVPAPTGNHNARIALGDGFQKAAGVNGWES